MYLRFFKLCVVITCLSQSLTRTAASSQYAVDMTASNGLIVQIPYCAPEIELTKKFSIESKNIGIGILQYLDKLVTELLAEKSISLQRWYHISKELKGLADKVPKIAIEIAEKNGFDKYFLDAMDRVTARAKAIGKRLDKRTANSRDWLQAEVHKSLAGVNEAIAISPKSIFIAWSYGHINFEPLEDYAAKLMGRLCYHGYSMLLSLTNAAIKGVFTFKNLKKKFPFGGGK